MNPRRDFFEFSILRNLAIVIALCVPEWASAREQAAIALTEDFTELSLDSVQWFFEDKGEARSLEDVTADSPDGNLFAPSVKKTPNFGFSDSTWWSRTIVDNPSDSPKTVYLSLTYPMMDYVDFFHVADGRLIKSTADGDRSLIVSHEIDYRLPTLKTEIPPGRSLLFIKVRSEGPINYGTLIFSEKSFHENHVFEYTFIPSIISILLVMVLYNFFILVQLRKTVYIIYISFISTMVYQSLCFSGLLMDWFPTVPVLYNHLYLFSLNLSMSLALLFSISFLSLKNRHPWLYRLCYLGSVQALVVCGLNLFFYNLSAKISAYIATFTVVTLLSCGLVCSLNRFRPAYFYSVAWLILLYATTMRMLALLGIIPLTFIVDWGPFIGSVIEAVLISMALADKVRITEQMALGEIASLNSKLKKEHAKVLSLNESLAERVEEQTREVTSILQHIQMGILVVRGKDQTITATHSDSIAEIFQTQSIEGRNVIDFLFHGAQTTSEVQSMARNVLSNCLNEDMINVEFNIHLLPRQLEYRFDDKERILEIDWNPVNDDGIVEKMLVTIKDVTLIRKMEADAAEKSKELSYIGEILEVPLAQFSRFMDSSQRFLADNERLIRINQKLNSEVLKILFINLHTIKGAARALGLKNLTPIIHDAEQDFAAIINKSKIWNQAEMLESVLAVRKQFDVYENLSLNKLGRSLGNTVTIPLDYAQQLMRFFHKIQAVLSGELRQSLKPLEKVVEDLLFVRAEAIFAEVLANSQLLARDLGKEQPRINIQDNGVMLSLKGQELIRNVFIHIIRNSMDHGIETAEERILLGKPASGQIDVKIFAEAGQLKILFKDDGRGLDLDAIRRLAEGKGLVKASDNLSPLDICYLIFESGLSTCNELTEISGRGMGMSAVKEYIEEHNGSVHIRLLNTAKSQNRSYQNFMLEFELDEEYLGSQSAYGPSLPWRSA